MGRKHICYMMFSSKHLKNMYAVIKLIHNNASTCHQVNHLDSLKVIMQT